VTRRLEVLLHGEPVGEISETSPSGTEFRFSDRYFDQVPRPVLGQRFEDDLERVHRSREREILPDFFANLTPEGRLRELLEQTTDLERGDDLALLVHVGGDLPGAVVVQPFEGEAVVSEERPRTGNGGQPDDEEAANGLRFSLAGVQLKLSMLREGEKLTVPVHDRAGEWIVKFDSPSFPHLPENEYSMLEWARAAGFDVPECHLHGLDDLDDAMPLVDLVRRLVEPENRVLAVRRYDRTDEGRVHQEDFAQAVGLPPARKYAQIRSEDMAVLTRRFVDEEAVDELVRRLVLTIAIGNGDAHLKNWSLIYPDRVRAAWSPLYDQVATVAWKVPARALALKLGGARDFRQIDRDAFTRFADRAKVDRHRVDTLIDETLERTRDAWQVLGELPIVSGHRRAIEEHWKQVPLLREVGLPS
jgi:serine/threonine-protein kinase HipA